jgi:DNA replication and repair protein RecF
MSSRGTSSCRCVSDAGAYPARRRGPEIDTVKLRELRLANLRNIESAQIELVPGLNIFIGPNGAGKTSILESAYLLSHARSFRTAQSDFLLRRGADELSVFGVLEHRAATTRLGLMRARGRWSARIEGETPPNLIALLRQCAVVCFEPGSHALISGATSDRRSFLDWGVFHVEHSYPEWMRRYRRALAQRNALLKSEPEPSELMGWDKELIAAAEPIAVARNAYFDELKPELARLCRRLIPELGDPIIEYRRGWSEEHTLDVAISQSNGLDRVRKYTARGPHRADWSLQFTGAPSREQLSRGQEKLCAIACMLAQAELFRSQNGEWPIVVLDDLASELDAAHQRVVVQSLLSSGAQVLVTGTDIPESLSDLGAQERVFHVEQGGVQQLI